MNTYTFIIILVLTALAVTGSFLVGFALGDYKLYSEVLKDPRPKKEPKPKKRNPPADPELEAKLDRLHKLNAGIERYDGGVR